MGQDSCPDSGYPSGDTAWIVGRNLFQNRLLSSHLAAQTSWNYRVVEYIEQVPRQSGWHKGVEGLLLVDCFDMNRETLLQTLNNGLKDHLYNWAVSLFNLGQSLDVEDRALQCGIRGLFYVKVDLQTLVKGLKAICEGEHWVPRRIMSEVFWHLHKSDPATFPPLDVDGETLSRRETEVLALLATGASNGTIAKKLIISPNTVRTHVQNIFKKLKVSNRTQATLWASKYLDHARYD